MVTTIKLMVPTGRVCRLYSPSCTYCCCIQENMYFDVLLVREVSDRAVH